MRSDSMIYGSLGEVEVGGHATDAQRGGVKVGGQRSGGHVEPTGGSASGE